MARDLSQEQYRSNFSTKNLGAIMEGTVASRNESGYDIIRTAMEILVSVYNGVPVDNLDGTSINLQAGEVCEILEMFFAYSIRFLNQIIIMAYI